MKHRNRRICVHELRPGDLLECSSGESYFVVSSTPNPRYPEQLRTVKVLSQSSGEFFDYEDPTVDRSAGDKYPFIHGRFLARISP